MLTDHLSRVVLWVVLYKTRDLITNLCMGGVAQPGWQLGPIGASQLGERSCGRLAKWGEGSQEIGQPVRERDHERLAIRP